VSDTRWVLNEAMAGSLRTITVRRLGFALQFGIPAGWTPHFAGSVLEVDAPGGIASLRVQQGKTPMTLAAIAAGFVTSEFATLRKQDPRASVVATQARVGAGTAIKVTMRYRGEWVGGKREITHVVYFLKHGSRAYQFDYGTASATASVLASFAASIDSVRFLGA